MALDKGCQRQQRERGAGNLGWARSEGSDPCIPMKRSNPMMWPYDAPGKTWARAEDGEYPSDSSRDQEVWPYKHTDLSRYVESAAVEKPTIDLSDGVYHGNPPPADGEEEDVAATGGGAAAESSAAPTSP